LIVKKLAMIKFELKSYKSQHDLLMEIRFYIPLDTK